jgi:competence ComEA-like helix-hairpin-helix protein
VTAPQGNATHSSWPRPAQLTAAFLLGVGATLLSVRLIAEPVRPMEFRSATFDINRASRTELLQLPGVGPSLADRMIGVRNSNGGFDSTDQLREVPGLGPARLERIQPLLRNEEKPRIGPSAAELIDVNTASLVELQTLPGIGPKLAQRIVDERAKSPFTSVDDLRRVSGIGPKTLEKLRALVIIKKN